MTKSGSASSKGFFRTARGRFAIFYLSPALLMYGFFVLWPLVNAFRLSMYRFTGLSQKTTFIGLDNFNRLARSDNFFQSLKNNVWLLVFSLSVIMVLALLIAHATQDDSRFGKFLRAVYLFPHVISLVVVAMLWKFIYAPGLGLIQPTLQAWGIEVPGLDFSLGILGASTSALPAVGVSFVWYALGFYIMVLAAGIRSIPEEVKEAAELDGASGLFRFWKVTWPLIWSVRRIVVIHIVIAVMNTFALVRLMTNGGPDGATEVTLTYLYKRGFSPDSFYGEATAIGVVNFVVAMALAGLVILLFRRDPTEARR
ncbi:MAG: sugar ABC transporter permease [Armatimonadetes bacterium]|nr:sugar ABC transporter permease [Armatimonadota bacterium]